MPSLTVLVSRNRDGDYDLACRHCGHLGTARGPYATGAEHLAAGHVTVHNRGWWG